MIEQYVYVKDDDYHWIPAVLISQTTEEATVETANYDSESQISGICDDDDDTHQQYTYSKRTVKLADYPNNALPLQNNAVDRRRNHQQYQTVDDMIELSFLHEAGILFNLKARHLQSIPYTRTGDIIIAVNPYQWFPSLYQEENRIRYSRTLVWEASKRDYDPRKDLPPHVYEASALAYKGLALGGINQSILVSGESGAGKTETVKICMDHLASVVQREHEQDGDESQDQTVIAKILDSNPLLEAFGNAKTRRNDNSSRFGKYIGLQFERGSHNKNHLTLLGSDCQVYLLEKSRVVRHESTERTFHIFYQLLAAPDETKIQFWSKLKGTTCSSFAYVGETETTKIEGVSDAEQFQNTLHSLSIIGIQGEILQTFMQAICIVLQLGNIRFGPHPDDGDHSIVTSTEEIDELAYLMGVAVDKLKTTLTKRLVKVRREETSVPLSQEAAKDSIDALAKQIYDRVFLWLVRCINEATTAAGDNQNLGIIGLLDIFGFESFPVNSFEQLCINFANEQLQQKFTQDVFVSVFEEYEKEGINLDEIHYDDNTDVLDLIQNPTGLLAMLNEECIRPNGSDYGFVHKALHANKTSPALIVPRIRSTVEFGIRHYAADVIYDATDFVSKNQDTLPSDLVEAACTSTNVIIAKELMTGASVQNLSKTATTRPTRKRSGNLVSATVWTKYKNQLGHLMEELHKSESRYIRCIKPNAFKEKQSMDHGLTLEQLRSSGVIAAVTLSRSAFPNRLGHNMVLDRFQILWPKGKTRQGLNNKTECEKLLTFALKPLENGSVKAFVIGNSRAYFRSGALEYLEASRLKGIEKPTILIQSIVRGFLGRKIAERQREERRLKQMNEKALMIQLAWRCHLARLVRRKLRKLRRRTSRSGKQEKAAIRIQSCVRMFLAKQKRNRKYARRVKRQSKLLYKERQLEKMLKKMEIAAIRIQSLTRGVLVRLKYFSLLQKAKQCSLLKQQIAFTRARIEKNDKKAHKQQEKVQKEIEKTRQGRANWAKKVSEIQQNSVTDESSKMVRYLQDQQYGLQAQIMAAEEANRPLKEDFGTQMETNEQLLLTLEKIRKKNDKLRSSHELFVQQKNAAIKEQETLEREISDTRTQFLPIVNCRAELQSAYQKIVNLVDFECKHAQLRDDIMLLAIDCLSSISALEKEAKADLTSPTKKQQRMLGGSFSNMPIPAPPLITPPSTGQPKKRATIFGHGDHLQIPE